MVGMLAQNVIKMNDNTMYEEIEAYLNELEIHSKGTRRSYETDIRQFVNVICKRDIEHVTLGELQKVKKKDIINYRKYLIDNFELANSTINNKITAPKSLFVYLSGEYDVNPAIFNIKNLKVHHSSYGNLSQTEAERFAEVAFLSEREKPLTKKLLILTAIRTSFRLNELLNIKWDDFEYSKGVYKVTTYCAKGGKINTTAISESLYNEIYKLKEENKLTKWSGNPEIVFQISEDAINNMMKRLREFLNIDPKRNVVFHSFRAVAIDYVLESTNGDITKAAIHANHSNPMTTYKHYVNKTKDYTQTPGVTMDQEMDMSFLDNVTIDALKEFILLGNNKLKMDFKTFIEIEGNSLEGNPFKIAQMTKSGELISTWYSVKEASDKLGINSSNISAACNGRQRTAGGFKWLYKEDFERLLSKQS
jgi:integrase